MGLFNALVDAVKGIFGGGDEAAESNEVAESSDSTSSSSDSSSAAYDPAEVAISQATGAAKSSGNYNGWTNPLVPESTPARSSDSSAYWSNAQPETHYVDPLPEAKAAADQNYQSAYNAYNDFVTQNVGHNTNDTSDYYYQQDLNRLQQNLDKAEQARNYFNPLIPNYTPHYQTSSDPSLAYDPADWQAEQAQGARNSTVDYYTGAERRADEIRKNPLAYDPADWQMRQAEGAANSETAYFKGNQGTPVDPYVQELQNARAAGQVYGTPRKSNPNSPTVKPDEKTEYYPWEQPEQKHDDTSAHWSTVNDRQSNGNPLFPSGRLQSEEGGYVNPGIQKAADAVKDFGDAVGAVTNFAQADLHDDMSAGAAVQGGRALDAMLKNDFDIYMGYAQSPEDWDEAYNKAIKDIVEVANATYGEDSGVAEQILAKIEAAQEQYKQVLNNASLTPQQAQQQIGNIQAQLSDATGIQLPSVYPNQTKADEYRAQGNAMSPGRVQNPEFTAEQQQLADEILKRIQESDDKDLKDLAKKALGVEFEDNAYGAMGASHMSGNINEYANQLAYELTQMSPDDKDFAEKLKDLDTYTMLLSYVSDVNKDALETEGAVEGMLASNAAYLPQLREQTESRAPWLIGFGFVGAAVGGVPGFTTALKIANIAGSVPYSYESMYGAAFRDMLYSENSANLSFDQMKSMAQDEAILSSIVEFGDTAVDTLARFPGAGKILKGFGGSKAASTLFGQVLKFAGGAFESAAGEYGEEGLQEMISIANQRRAAGGGENGPDSGLWGLAKEFVGVAGEVASSVANGEGLSNEQTRQVHEAGMGGAYIGLPGFAAGGAVNNLITAPMQSSAMQIVNYLDRNKNRSGIYEGVLNGTVSEENAKDFTNIAKGKTEEEFKSGLDTFEKYNGKNNFKAVSKGDVLLDGDSNPVGTVTKANGKTVTIELTGEDGKKTTETINVVGLHGYLDSESKTAQILGDDGKIVSADEAADVAAFKSDAEARRKEAEARKAGAKATMETDSGTGTPGGKQTTQESEQSEQSEEPPKKAPSPGKPSSNETTDSGTGTPIGEQSTQTNTDTSEQPASEKKAPAPGKPASSESTDSGTGTPTSAQTESTTKVETTEEESSAPETTSEHETTTEPESETTTESAPETESESTVKTESKEESASEAEQPTEEQPTTETPTTEETSTATEETGTEQQEPKSKAQEFFDNKPQKGRVYTSDYKGATVKIKNNGDGTYTVSMASPLKNGTGFSKAAKTIGTVSSIDEANQLVVDEYNRRNPNYKAFSDTVGTTPQNASESPVNASAETGKSTLENNQESTGASNEKLNDLSGENPSPSDGNPNPPPSDEPSGQPKTEQPKSTEQPKPDNVGAGTSGAGTPPNNNNNNSNNTKGSKSFTGNAKDLNDRTKKKHGRSRPRSAFSNERIFYRIFGKTNKSMRNFQNISRLANSITSLLDGNITFEQFNNFAKSGKNVPIVGNVLDERMRQELSDVAALEKAIDDADDKAKATADYQEAAARASAHLAARMEMVEETERAKANFDKYSKASGKKGNRNKFQNAMDWNTRMQISGDNFWRMMGNWDKNSNNDGYSYADQHNRSIASRISEEAKLKSYYADIDTESKEFKDFASGKTMSNVDFGGHKISLMEAIKFVKLVNTMNEYDKVQGNPDMNRVSSLDGFCFKNKNGDAVFVDIEGDQAERAEWVMQRYQDALDEINNNKAAKAYMEATENMYEESAKDANKVFSNVNGYDRYMYSKGNYTDIHYANRDGSVDFSYDNKDATDVHDTGVMQNRTRDLGGYVIVNPMSQSVDAYISQISDYIAFEEFGQKLDVLQSKLMNNGSLNSTIKETYGKQFDEWFDNYVKSMTLYKQRGEKMSVLDKGLQKARQLMMSGALVGSVSVPIKQVSSFFDTFGMLDPAATMKAFLRNPAGRRVKGINNYLYEARTQSISDPDYAELFGDKGLFSKAKDIPILKGVVKLATKGTNMMDVNAVSNVYKACVYDVEMNSLPADRLYKNGKNFKDGLTAEGQFYVDSKFEEVLLGTQPIFTPQARNELSRTDNQMLKMIQTFRTQQTQNFNRSLQTWNEYLAADGSAKGEAFKKFTQTQVGHITAAASLSALTAIAQGVLHKHRRYKDDDDELDDEKFKRKFLYGMVESMAGNYLWAGDLTKWMIDMYNSHNDPNWDWKYSSKESQYFDIGKNIHIPIVSSGALGTALQVLNSTISLCEDVDENGWTDSNKLSARYVAGNVATSFGVPMNNVYYFMNGVYQWYNDIAYKVTGDKKYDPKYDDLITQMLKVDYSQQNRLVNAILKGNQNKIDDFFENMGQDKFANAVYYGALDNYKSGKINRQEYIDMLVNFGGKTYNDAVKDVDKKIALIDSGISQFNGIDGRDGRAAFYDQYSGNFKSKDVYKDFFTDVKNGKKDGRHNTYYTTYYGKQQEVSANQSSIIDRMNENIKANNFDYNTAKLLWENYYGYSTGKSSAWQFVGK